MGVNSHVQLELDTDVIVAFKVAGKPMAVACVVTHQNPSKLYSRDTRIANVEFPQPIYVVWHEASELRKAEATAICATPWRSGYEIEIERTVVNEADRRVHPRYEFKAPINVRCVSEVNEAIVIAIGQGETIDLSQGGAWARLGTPVSEGTVVEFVLNLDDSTEIRGLAIVVHAKPDRNEVGLEFLDLYNDSRELLKNRLQAIA